MKTCGVETQSQQRDDSFHPVGGGGGGLAEIPFFKTAKLHDLKNKGATKQSKTHKRQKV